MYIGGRSCVGVREGEGGGWCWELGVGMVWELGGEVLRP
jgi:hypothetical protein